MKTELVYDPRDPAYWHWLCRFHLNAHAQHLAAASAARLNGTPGEAARCLREAIISRNLLVICREHRGQIQPCKDAS